MCSVLESLDMDNFQGDLTDVVRGIGSGNGSSSPGPPEVPSLLPTSDHHVDIPSVTSAVPTSCHLNPFGDPFVSMRNPLLHLPANSSHYGDSGDNKSNNSFAIFPKAKAMAAHGNTAASLWGMINVDTTNSPRNCLLVNDNNNTSSSSQIQISSSPRHLGIKRRKSQAKKVVCIPAPAAMNSRSSGEVVPSDLWAWRKYGQKPIKGSPYPRGYYRCSSSKGCSARKQVERSRTDPNMLVITYTSEHNHTWPTQRNALAGSTRSTFSSVSNPSSKSATATTTTSSRLSQNNNKTHLSPSTSPPLYAVKEEDMEERHDNIEFDKDVKDTYKPELLPKFQHGPQDFFTDLDELEGDSLTMLLTQGFAEDSSRGGSLEKKNVFSEFFDQDDDYDSSRL